MLPVNYGGHTAYQDTFVSDDTPGVGTFYDFLSITMVWKEQSTGKNISVPLPTGKKDVSVNTPAPIQIYACSYESERLFPPPAGPPKTSHRS